VEPQITRAAKARRAGSTATAARPLSVAAEPPVLVTGILGRLRSKAAQLEGSTPIPRSVPW